MTIKPINRSQKWRSKKTGRELYEGLLAAIFIDYLNIIHGYVNICGYPYDSGTCLMEVDPIAFRENFLRWLDNTNWEAI